MTAEKMGAAIYGKDFRSTSRRQNHVACALHCDDRFNELKATANVGGMKLGRLDAQGCAKLDIVALKDLAPPYREQVLNERKAV